jgi:hypothetical protein
VASKIALPGGAYAIQAEVGICDRVHEGPFQSHVPAGMFASTFALVSGDDITGDIKGANISLFGAFVQPAVPAFFPGARPALDVVGAFLGAATLKPAFDDLTPHPRSTRGLFRVDVSSPLGDLSNPLVFGPAEVVIGQRTPGLSLGKHQTAILKPNPYTRVVWLGTSPDFSVAIQPGAHTLGQGQTRDVTVNLIPNGVPRQAFPPSCPINLIRVPGLPGGVTADLIQPPGANVLGEKAPRATSVPLRISVDSSADPGTYPIEVQGTGSTGSDCEGIVRSATFLLTVAQPRPQPCPIFDPDCPPILGP